MKTTRRVPMTGAISLLLIFSCSQLSLLAGQDEIKSKTFDLSGDDWKTRAQETTGIEFKEDMAVVNNETALYRSKVIKLDKPTRLQSLVVEQSEEWKNWEAVDKVGPANLGDAPVFLARGEKDYWLFGLYGKAKKNPTNFKAEPVTLEGFDVPLITTPYKNQYNAPGGLNPSLGGYHAWQSRDMVHWVHHGPVTEKFSRWVTTAEMVDGKTYIYYDYPNDQDPHLYIDDDLTDGKPGNNIGMAFADPSHGSDCAVIRDLDGKFHVIYEDWSPINARKHSWDSPLAGHAVGSKGYQDFEIVAPAVDARTKPTGETATYLHPHWKNDHPDWDSNVAEYQVHEPEQDAFGDWAAIAIGDQYYLFADFHPANDKIRIGCFTSSGLDQPFERYGELGSGHPDPDIGFAEGQFYLINQTRNDYISPGPWVGTVEARAGVDTNGDNKIDQWTDWQLIRETYERIEGFSKQIKRNPATLDTADLPAGSGIAFELRIKDAEDPVKPELKSVHLNLAE